MPRQQTRFVNCRLAVAVRPVNAFERCPCGAWTEPFNNLPLCKDCWSHGGSWRQGVAHYHQLSLLDRTASPPARAGVDAMSVHLALTGAKA